VVHGAPQIIWRRIGTHDVVSDLSCRVVRAEVLARGANTRDSSYTGATAGSAAGKPLYKANPAP
jgi:hypothetical protein